MASTPPDETAVALSHTLVAAPTPRTVIDAADSSLPTLMPPPLAAAPDTPFTDDAFTARYESRGLIGEGGMGEVRLTRDLRIGRDVAMKVVRVAHEGSRHDLQQRFLREARVQGQLEHPSIVPVYEMGRDPLGRIYFTMKRVRGLTLEQILAALLHGDAHLAALYSRRRLLAALSSVCLAVDFAHVRGIVHRDLKPGNLMFGDYGEVYVLDWGLAKLAGVADGEPLPLLDSNAGSHTAYGAIMGTPGYMAPEQARGEVDHLDARADVYALGAILFEILAGEPLHPQRSALAATASTLGGVEARPSLRTPQREVPPELEEICVRATALEPADRLASAREMQALIERFLDGDRDLARRHELAAQHAAAAAVAAERALAADAVGPERSQAMAEVNRALALDPGNADALRTLVRLVSEPPPQLPAAVLADEQQRNEQARRAGARNATVAYASFFLYLPGALWMGMRSWGLWSIAAICWASASLLSLLYARRGVEPPGGPLAVMVIVALGTASLTTMFGPYIMLPTLATVNAVVFILGRYTARQRLVHVALSCLAVAVPAVLEWLHVLPPAFRFTGGTMVVLPQMLELPPLATQAFLFATSVGFVITAAFFVGKMSDVMATAERRTQFQTWQLRQLIPEQAQDAVTASAAPQGEPRRTARLVAAEAPASSPPRAP